MPRQRDQYLRFFNISSSKRTLFPFTNQLCCPKAKKAGRSSPRIRGMPNVAHLQLCKCSKQGSLLKINKQNYTRLVHCSVCKSFLGISRTLVKEIVYVRSSCHVMCRYLGNTYWVRKLSPAMTCEISSPSGYLM